MYRFGALESYEKTRGLAFMLGSGTEMEWIEELELADAIDREKRRIDEIQTAREDSQEIQSPRTGSKKI